MLRHLKISLKKQQEEEQRLEQLRIHQLSPSSVDDSTVKSIRTDDDDQVKQIKRSRGQRSSKPQMEKRRRARINECLDILKSYVLTDPENVKQSGLELNSTENKQEEIIARNLIKSSGLINRHRGRKNLSKLEKADILELTVDYVRRLHQQRDQLIGQRSHQSNTCSDADKLSPLTLCLPKTLDRVHLGLQATPPSSASSSPQPLLAISSNIPVSSFGVLDLSDSRRAKVVS